MPTTEQVGIPLPATFEELESITCDFFSNTFHTPFQKWGRSGQQQCGIDIFGKDWNGRSVGVQCKNYQNARLTEDILRNDIKKAEEISPPLERMYFVTTAPRDVKIQNFCMGWRGKFPVEIYYWEVLERFLQLNPAIKDLYYPTRIDKEPTQLFINEFLKLCGKYNIYQYLYENDYVTPYSESVYEDSELFCAHVTSLLVSEKSLNVDKTVLRDTQFFKDVFEMMIDQAAMFCFTIGNGRCVSRFPEESREEIEQYFVSRRKELIEIYSKYKF